MICILTIVLDVVEFLIRCNSYKEIEIANYEYLWKRNLITILCFNLYSWSNSCFSFSLPFYNNCIPCSKHRAIFFFSQFYTLFLKLDSALELRIECVFFVFIKGERNDFHKHITVIIWASSPLWPAIEQSSALVVGRAESKKYN